MYKKITLLLKGDWLIQGVGEGGRTLNIMIHSHALCH